MTTRLGVLLDLLAIEWLKGWSAPCAQRRSSEGRMDPTVAFDAFSGGKKYMDVDDLSCAAIAVFGTKFRKQDLRAMLAQYSPPSTPGVGLEAFRALVADRRRLLGERDRAFRMFTALDLRGRGYLDLRTFSDACSSVGRPVARRACEIFHDMDRSKTGMVTVADFEAYLSGASDLDGKTSE
mmetsp:Transcript_130334/g.416874  ORF Transcript_130334/g.416874 Transcript_130334/m.416874 type:complete len:181 (-) Transcript_130334:163-705(-)